eukprot:COSAG03_NODE_640_length_6556_cov_4.146817_4_plen_286_part_00
MRVCVCVCAACKARGSDLRVHFKNTRETAFAIKNLTLKKARQYLEDVIAHKTIVPFRKFAKGVGRKAQVKAAGGTDGRGRWPQKSCKFLLDLLTNAESNAEVGPVCAQSSGGWVGLREVHREQVEQTTAQSAGLAVAAGPLPGVRVSCLRTFGQGRKQARGEEGGRFACLLQRVWLVRLLPVLTELLRLRLPFLQTKGLDPDLLKITHIQVNRSQKQRRRMYRAHGRINPMLSNPCHIELIMTEDQDATVAKAEEEEKPERKRKISKKKIARQRLAQGQSGGFDI